MAEPEPEPEMNDIPEERESVASGPFPESIDTKNARKEAAQREQLEILARRRLVQARAATGQSGIWNAIQSLDWISKK